MTSTTARVVAIYRAIETLHRDGLFRDPYAVELLPMHYRVLAWFPPVAALAWNLIRDKSFDGDVAQGLARTALIDELYVRAAADGCRQVVILGAGFDTRAWRLPTPMRVFELDRPSTQAVKQARLSRVGVEADVTFVPIDLNTSDVAAALAERGWDATQPTFFLWEGVTYFLEEPAVLGTLELIAGCAPGSSVVFDYTFDEVVRETSRWPIANREARLMSELGEPFRFGFAEGAVVPCLERLGFTGIVEYPADLLDARYFTPRGRPERVAPFLPLVEATVGPAR